MLCAQWLSWFHNKMQLHVHIAVSPTEDNGAYFRERVLCFILLSYDGWVGIEQVARHFFLSLSISNLLPEYVFRNKLPSVESDLWSMFSITGSSFPGCPNLTWRCQRMNLESSACNTWALLLSCSHTSDHSNMKGHHHRRSLMDLPGPELAGDDMHASPLRL